MAKKHKKTTKRRTHHRRRRMGAVHPALAQAGEMIAGAAIGAVVETFANQAIKSSFPTAPSYLGGALGVAGGAAILLLAPPSPLLTGAAVGMGGMGGAFMLNESFLSLPGISGAPREPMMKRVAGPGYISDAVNGFYRNMPANRIGNFSGGGAKSVNGIYSN